MNRRTVQAAALALVVALVFAVDLTGLWRPVRSGIALAQGAAQGGTTVDWWVIAGGGAPSSSGSITLNDTIGQPVIGPAAGEGVTLGAGYWVGCVAAAAATPVVTVSRSGDDVVLAWGADPNSAQYQVFVSTDPYFDPGGVTPVVTASTTHTDTGAAVSLTNHFYIVRGLNACGAASANSFRKGEFTYGLAPGN